MDVLALLFAARCGGCGAYGAGLCERCAVDLVLERFTVRGDTTLAVTALGRYEGALRRAVLCVKRGRRDVARALGERLRAHHTAEELVVAAPTSRRRVLQRGFDQAALLALAIGGRLQAVLRLDGATQRGASRAQRLRRRVILERGQVEGRHVVVVDDVCSTGATLLACARALREAGALSVRGLVVARAERPATPAKPARRCSPKRTADISAARSSLPAAG